MILPKMHKRRKPCHLIILIDILNTDDRAIAERRTAMSIFNPTHHFISITAFYALSLTEYDMHAHAHASCEIMYVTKGNCHIYVNHEAHCLEERQFIFLDAEVPHRLWIPKGSPCSLLNLEFR